MNKLFFILLAGSLAASCGNSTTTDSTNPTTAAPGTPGTDNVHGNIPDTTTAIKPNRPLPVDSSMVDSMPR